jgi:hypothetical protein
VTISRHGWALTDGSVAQLYQRMVAGVLGEETANADLRSLTSFNGRDRSAADRAREMLSTMRAELWRPGEDGAVYHTVMAIAVDGSWPPWLKRLLAGRGWGAGGSPKAQDWRRSRL